MKEKFWIKLQTILTYITIFIFQLVLITVPIAFIIKLIQWVIR